MLSFSPKVLRGTSGRPLKALRVHVRDHKQRELPVGERTLEAYYAGFTFSQMCRPLLEARRLATEVSYGVEPREVLIGRHKGRMYELGPEVLPDDIDGRSPAVIVWNDGPLFCVIASEEMTLAQLLPVAHAIYAD